MAVSAKSGGKFVCINERLDMLKTGGGIQDNL
jgi:hypothetical protein